MSDRLALHGAHYGNTPHRGPDPPEEANYETCGNCGEVVHVDDLIHCRNAGEGRVECTEEFCPYCPTPNDGIADLMVELGYCEGCVGMAAFKRIQELEGMAQIRKPPLRVNYECGDVPRHSGQ